MIEKLTELGVVAYCFAVVSVGGGSRG
jgi:hypothetical protein